MFSPALVLALLAATAPPKLASTGFTSVQVEEKTADFFAEFFAQQLQQRGVTITTRSQVAAVMGMERQRQLLGCSSESTSCLAELAGALGVDGLVIGNVARFGAEYVATVKLVSAKNGAALLTDSTRVPSDRALLDWYTQVAERWAPQLHRSLPAEKVARADPTARAQPQPPPEELVSTPEPSTGPGVAPWIVGGAGVAMLVGSAVTYAVANGEAAQLRSGTGISQYGDVQATKSAGVALEGTSVVLLAGGAICAGIGGILLLTAPHQPTAAVTPIPGGAMFAFGGELP